MGLPCCLVANVGFPHTKSLPTSPTHFLWSILHVAAVFWCSCFAVSPLLCSLIPFVFSLQDWAHRAGIFRLLFMVRYNDKPDLFDRAQLTEKKQCNPRCTLSAIECTSQKQHTLRNRHTGTEPSQAQRHRFGLKLFNTNDESALDVGTRWPRHSGLSTHANGCGWWDEMRIKIKKNPAICKLRHATVIRN